MQNPGSDAGVFVWAGGAHGRHCAVNAPCHVTLKSSQRHAEENTTRSLGYPCYAHGAANIRWCVLTKKFARESDTEPTVRLFVAQSNVGAGSRLTTSDRTRSASSRDVASVAGNALA